jgi:CRISPR system Cascade subunit CasA
MFSFNLIEEKWLPCLMLDNSLQYLSLRDVLTDATKIREIVGDSPPVTVALHRLLLAILHRALNAPQNYEDWQEFWEAKSWNTGGKLEKYLADWQHRFDLFDENRPFYQASSIKESVQDGAIIQLYFQGKNNATLFDHSTTGKPKPVSPAEAARFLITFQGFDVGGIKADGSAQTAPLLQSAIALVRGENLFETLMLNFHAYNENDEMPFKFSYKKDLPAWERESETEVIERQTLGFVDLLTWQARRILLQPQVDENGEITVKNTVIMRGFQFPKTYQRDKEEVFMAFKKSKTEGFYSVGFNENKALWRDSLSLFQTIKDENYSPKILTWLNELVAEGVLQRSNVFPIEFYGLAADKAKLLFWQQDRFNLPLAYLNNNDLLNDLGISIKFAEDIAGVLKFSIKNLAEKLETDAANFSAMQIYWSSLETQFQKLLSDLPNEKQSAMQTWFEFTDKTAKQAFDDTANSLSGSAIEQKAIIEAESSFYRTRAKLLNENANYRENLPNYKTKGGKE